nr:FAD-binding protein [Streptomyces spiramenti]
MWQPGTPEYAEATAVFNLAAEVRPRAAVVARSVAEVRSAVRLAARSGRGLRTLGTGHAAGAVRPFDESLLLRTRLPGGVRVDADRRAAWVPAGTCWADVVAAAAPHGLAAVHGSSGGVGVVGYLLGGGVSFYGRRRGLAVNSLRAAELVVADGSVVTVTEADDPELLWALRGGGGGFGVVTAVEIDLFPAAEVFTGGCYWPGGAAAELLDGWSSWTGGAPRAATTSFRVMNLPELPGVPPVLAGRTVVCVDGAVAADDPAEARDAADGLLGPLRSLGEPLLDTWRGTGPEGVLLAHLDPPAPVPFVGDHLLLRDLAEGGVAAFLGVVGADSGSPLAVATLRQLGGAFAESGPPAALGRLDGQFAYMGSGPPVGPVTVSDLRAHGRAVRAALAGRDTGRTVPSLVESHDGPQRHLDGPTARAVRRVRERVDPEGLFGGDASPGSLP